MLVTKVSLKAPQTRLIVILNQVNAGVSVPQCTTGRVFLLKFRDSTTRRFFYWLQEPKEEKDEDLLKKVCRKGRG